MTVPVLSQPNLRHEWQAWDNMENVTVRSRKNNGDWEDFTVRAKRRAMSFKDLAGGVYTTQDRKWLVPVELVTVGPLKPSDIIETADGTQWTVLEAPLNTWETWYGLMTRNLVIAYDLRDLIDILQPTNALDASGNRSPTAYTTLVSRLAARIQFEGTETIDAFGKHALSQSYTCIISKPMTVTNEMRVVKSGTTTPIYQIKGTRDPARIDELMKLDMEILP